MLTGEHLLTKPADVTDPVPTGARDGYGNVLTAPAVRERVPFWYYQISGDEVGVVAGQTHWGFLPPGDPVKATSSIAVDGLSFEVIGPPAQDTNPRTTELGLVRVVLRRTDG